LHVNARRADKSMQIQRMTVTIKCVSLSVPIRAKMSFHRYSSTITIRKKFGRNSFITVWIGDSEQWLISTPRKSSSVYSLLKSILKSSINNLEPVIFRHAITNIPIESLRIANSSCAFKTTIIESRRAVCETRA